MNATDDFKPMLQGFKKNQKIRELILAKNKKNQALTNTEQKILKRLSWVPQGLAIPDLSGIMS